MNYQDRKHHPLCSQLLKKLLLCFVAVVSSLLLVELVLQVRHKGTSVDRWAIPDKRYGFLHRKTFEQQVRYGHTNVTWKVSINSLGFRGPELDLDTPGVLRILLLGDSFTFGYGVEYEQTFGNRLEQNLSEAGISNIVINAGVTGWGTLQALLFARDSLDWIKPDIIILTFCENDQIDDEVFLRGGARGLLPAFPGKRWLRDHSKVYSILYNRLYSQLYKRLFHSESSSQPKVNVPDDLIVKPSSREDQVLGSSVWWDRTSLSIYDFLAFYTNHFHHGFMLIQTAELWKPAQAKHLKIIAERDRIKFVDLAEETKGLGQRELSLDYDPHWNAYTHELSGARLAREIQALLANPPH